MFKAKIYTDNAAFHDYEDKESDRYARNREVARILREIADNLEEYYKPDGGICVDYNGNVVGEWNLNNR